MKRVLVFLHTLTLGGIEIMLLKSLPYLKKRSIHIDVCCTGPEAELDEQFRRVGSKIYRVRRSLNLYYTARRIRSLVLAGDYDLVHSHYGHASGGAALGAKLAGAKAIVSFHSTKPEGATSFDHVFAVRIMKSWWLTLHRHYMNQCVSKFIGHSEANLDGYCPDWRTKPDSYAVVRNGIDFKDSDVDRGEIRKRLGFRDQDLVFLHVGSFKKPKNHEGLLQIFSEVSRRHSDVRLVMVGEGKLRPRISRLATKMGIASMVSMVGNTLDPWEYYFACDVFVFPSFWEGFGNALVESQGACLPIVASDIPGHREAVCSLQHRFLFPLPDYRRAAELIFEQIRAREEGCNDWVAASAGYVKSRFSVIQMAEALAQTYEEVIQGREGVVLNPK